MEGPNRKLVVLLCMHRSGSSLTANILQKLGMSLGPFDLIAAAPSNPYGHFESIPFHSLNRRLQEWAFGFADDVPDDPAVLARFRETRGAWPAGKTFPDEWLDEAEKVTRALIESWPVSGFKDPRTVLVWPFWQKVFERIEGVDVVPATLLRSPHEIAMSLCSRSRGNMPYWDALDVVGVHLERMKAASQAEGSSHVVRFGTPEFWQDTKSLAEACGLPWDEATVARVYDPSCVHHLPAAVAHEGQRSLNELGDDAWADFDAAANAERIAADARKYEAAMHGQLVSTRSELGKTIVQLRQVEYQLTGAQGQARELEMKAVLALREAATAQQALVESDKGFQLAKTCLDQTEKQLGRVMETLVSNQERRVQAEQMLAHTQGVLAHNEQAMADTQRRLADAHEQQERLLKLFQQTHSAALNEHEQERRRWESERSKIEEAERRIVELQEAAIRKEQQLVRSLEREEKRWLENVALRRRIEKFESNAIIGAAVKGRRQIQQIWLKIRHLGPNGEPRSTRVDRPL